MSENNGSNVLNPLLTLIAKVIALLYILVIVSAMFFNLLTGKTIDASILASITALMTTVLGGLLTAVIRRRA